MATRTQPESFAAGAASEPVPSVASSPRQCVPVPIFRKLRVFAMDPGLTARFETSVMNEMTLGLPWEPVEPGPAGEYVEVVDEDQHGKTLYDPLDLNRALGWRQRGSRLIAGREQWHQRQYGEEPQFCG